MQDFPWSAAEKKVARRAFEQALERANAEFLAEVKQRVAAASTAREVWALEDFLREERRAFAFLFDYRYSQLILGFAIMLHRGLLEEEQLQGLSPDKLEAIRDTVRRSLR